MASAEIQKLIVALELYTGDFDSKINYVGGKMLDLQRKTALLQAELNKISASKAFQKGQITQGMVGLEQSLARVRAGYGSVQSRATAMAAMDARFARQKSADLDTAERQAAKAAQTEARYLTSQAALSRKAYQARAALHDVAIDTQMAGIAAAAELNARRLDDQAAAAERATAKLRALAGVGRTALSGGVTFLTRSFLLTAGAAAVLESQFLKISDAQAALARTLDNESAPAIAALNEEILKLSETIPLSTTELYRIAELAGTLGFAAKDIDEFTTVVAQLAATTDLTVDEAATSFGRLLNIFHIGVDEADNLGSALVKLSVSQASSDQAILTTTERFASLATAMGLLPPQILAIASAGTALGQEPEAVGGSLQRIFGIFNKLLGQEKVTQKLKDFAAVSGLTVKELRAQWATNPMEGFLTFLEGFGKLTPQQQAQLFGPGELFPSFVRGAQTLQNLSAQLPLLRRGIVDASDAFKDGNLLAEQAATRFDTLKNNLQLLGNAFIQLGYRFGAAFGGEANDAIKEITQSVLDAIPAAEEFGRKVGKFLADIDWSAAARYAKTFFDIIKGGAETAVGILKALPAPILEAIALYKTLNFLSGGAVGELGGGLVGSIGGALVTALGRILTTGRFSAAFVQPVFVTNQGFGGVGGGLTIAGVSIAAIAAGVGAVILSQLPKFTTGPPSGNTGRDVLGLNSNPFGFLFPNPGPSQRQSSDFGHGSDIGLLANQVDKAAAQYAAGMRDDLAQTEMFLDATNIYRDAVTDFINGLKPEHRRGEVGKSVQTTEGRKLLNLDVTGAKFDAALADLVKHYTKEPIGSPGHSRSFVLGNLNPIENRLGRELKKALKSGDGGRADDIIASLKALDKVPKNDLPAWIRKLIARADANSEEEKHKQQQTKNAVNTMADRTTGALGIVRRAIAAKHLSVRVAAPRVTVRGAPVHVGATVVRVTVGTRTVTRVVRTQTAYGPNLVFQQPGQIYEGPN